MESPNYQVKIIFFDGICVLCNRVVDFLIRHDKKQLLKFAALQSELAGKLIDLKVSPEDQDTVIYFDSGKIFTRSEAVLRIAEYLGFPYNAIKMAYLLPLPVRDAIYDYIAGKRFRWFGKRDFCRMPDEETRGRILSTPDEIPDPGKDDVIDDDHRDGGKAEKDQ
jgi:predicted DCC family thiol-disulfide oxidoreductase YuxK